MKGRVAKATFALAAALVFVSGPARATESVTFDGVWWQGLRQAEKVVAIEGMLAGYDSGYRDGWLAGYYYAVFAYAVPFSKLQNATQTWNGMSKKETSFSKPFGTYIDEIDAWYEGHPDKLGTVYTSALLVDCFSDSGPQGYTTPNYCVASGSGN